ncbi:MAG: radical SAM protein [Geobacteraceae bacterium]|nr:radical SAM protein [Geobacteraceae bacterium]
MKLLLIMPDAHMHRLKIGPFVRSMREMPLSICTLAALTPEYPDLDIRLIDGSVEPVPLDYDADLVAISVITGCAASAYAIADHYRGRNIPVVLGGVHVTILPGEAIRHADAIVIGRAEKAWPRLIEDFRSGRMQKIYEEDDVDDLFGVPSPRRDLHRRSGYMVPDSIQATRGCKKVCDFCTVPAVWPKYLRRPVDDVIRDIRATKGRYIAFNDVSIAEDPEYAKELFTAMIPLGRKWGGLATVDIVNDPELLELMKASGCGYLLFGFESDSQATLKGIRKGFNKPVNYEDVIRAMHAINISVQGCFVFGFDHDTNEVFQRTVELVNDLKIDIPRYSLYTPYPGTELFRRLQGEDRILSYNWDDYDTMHVVIQPALMTPEELYSGFKQAYRETFRLPGVIRRMRGLSTNTAINFIGNLTYQMFVRRLYNEQRFSAPYSMLAPGSAPDEGWYRSSFRLAEVP